jgi:hypothetical protein
MAQLAARACHPPDVAEPRSVATPTTGDLDLTDQLTCDWRPGDVW